MNHGIQAIFGPDGQSHLASKSGNMTFVDGQAYAQVGNMAFGSDGETYLQVGNAVIGPDGQANLKFGDNPTFLV